MVREDRRADDVGALVVVVPFVSFVPESFVPESFLPESFVPFVPFVPPGVVEVGSVAASTSPVARAARTRPSSSWVAPGVSTVSWRLSSTELGAMPSSRI
ncbi:MAG: hypothetical protein ACYC2O_13405, partial [Microthrixaceae bacterium]